MNTLLISGDEPLLRERTIKGLLAHTKQEPTVVTQEQIASSIGGNPFLDMDEVVYCPEVTDKLEIKSLKGGDRVTLVLQYQGRLKETSRLGAWGKAHGAYHRKLNRPEKSWELRDYVVEFLISEFRTAGKICSKDLADALTNRLGSDLGHLRFEVFKIVTAMGPDLEVTVNHLRGILSPMGEASTQGIIDAISDHDLAKFMRTAMSVRESHSSDPTIKVTRYLVTHVVKWLQALLLVQKQGKEAAIGALGVNPWYFENKVLPPARRWGEQKLRKLIAICAQAEVCLFEGRISAWDYLVASIAELHR